jgi:hypothetical protein
MLAGAALAALCAPARAEPPAAFPATVDRAGLTTWLKQETDITPAQVIAVSPSAVTAVLGTIETRVPDGIRMALRAEAIDPKVSDREGVLSWHMLVEVDCPGRKLRQGPTTGYVGRNLLGEGRQIRPGSEAWVAPPPGAQLENVWRAACEAGFQRPLAPPRFFSIAQVATPTAAAAPKVAARAPLAMAAVSQAPAPYSEAAVQLGAMATRAAAEAVLADLKARFADAMHGLSTGVAPASVQGRTLYRALVTGFSRDADANRFCVGLKAGGVACFVR